MDREELRRGLLVVGGDVELVSCGPDVMHRKIAIVDPETLTRCHDDTIGEIWVSGPDVALGYWNKPKETKDTFDARIAGEEVTPYLRTGDLGVCHDGQLYITGRLKDVMIVDGRNHFPQDIELSVESADERVRKNCVAAFGIELAGVESSSGSSSESPPNSGLTPAGSTRTDRSASWASIQRPSSGSPVTWSSGWVSG
ncbi:MAG: hypothetical protein CSA58_00265 [Micrococcales bacterium]|nr:MAG: hypothetical protein CSA58_00265 [Micrococcales bacterium]